MSPLPTEMVRMSVPILCAWLADVYWRAGMKKLLDCLLSSDADV
jgi:hypothetical protein